MLETDCSISAGLGRPSKAKAKMNHLVACPVCASQTFGGRIAFRRTVQRAGGTLECQFAECGVCRHVFLNPQPTLSELEGFYDADYHVFSDQPKSAEWVASLLNDRFDGKRLNHASFVRGGKFLDVGCGLGDMVAAMQSAGMDAIGVDPSSIAIESGKRYGRDLRCGTLDQHRFAEASFDSISMYHSLEHNPDPVATLAEAARILKRGAALMVSVPNFQALAHAWFGPQWRHLDPPYHLQHFCAQSLELAGKRVGLLLRQMQTESFVDHMEAEFARWARRRLLVPQRLSLRVRVFRPVAKHLFATAKAANRGDALIAHFERV